MGSYPSKKKNLFCDGGSNDGCRLFGQEVNQYAISPGTAILWLEECEVKLFSLLKYNMVSSDR